MPTRTDVAGQGICRSGHAQGAVRGQVADTLVSDRAYNLRPMVAAMRCAYQVDQECRHSGGVNKEVVMSGEQDIRIVVPIKDNRVDRASTPTAIAPPEGMDSVERSQPAPVYGNIPKYVDVEEDKFLNGAAAPEMIDAPYSDESAGKNGSEGELNALSPEASAVGDFLCTVNKAWKDKEAARSFEESIPYIQPYYQTNYTGRKAELAFQELKNALNTPLRIRDMSYTKDADGTFHAEVRGDEVESTQPDVIKRSVTDTITFISSGSSFLITEHTRATRTT